MALACWSSCLAQSPGANGAINQAGTTYDSHPVAVVAADGSTWVSWHAYEAGSDRIHAARLQEDGTTAGPLALSDGGTTHGPPAIAASSDSTWVVWSQHQGGKWRAVCRRFHLEKWQKPISLSETDSNAIYPAVMALADDSLLVAWSSRQEGRFRIRARMCTGATWHASFDVSLGRHDSWRPRIAQLPNGAVWIVWDAYNGSHYVVRGRKVLPDRGGVEQISPSGQHCLNPTLLGAESGLYVAWVRKSDVIGGPGVVSQLHTLHVARRVGEDFIEVRGQGGSTVAAELSHGLMAQIAPSVVPTGGYLGQRTEPMLMETSSGVWLLWERKSDHRGRTWQVVGDLLGRPVEQHGWGETRTLHHGLVDYHTVEPCRARAGRFAMLASQLPRQNRRLYHRIMCDVAQTSEFAQDRWEGWFPLELPAASELPGRKEIDSDDGPLKLYWADLHCHSGLTADAEGEPDELMLYARDRARLDVVTFTNNDFIYDVPLTQYEYVLSNSFAEAYTREDFLALPGFEWTSRIPGVAGAAVADVGNWTPPYQNRSYPNHRSVIYPVSGGPLLHYPEIGNDISKLHAAVSRAGGITLTQHDAFRVTGDRVEVAMELTSGWSRYIADRPSLFHEPLNRGLRLGFVACGDTHRRAPGMSGALTGIYARELTSASILEALRARRCFATSGSRMIIDSRANGSVMGAEVAANDGSVSLRLHAIGTRPILSATLIRDGSELKTFSGVGERVLRVELLDKPRTGTHWYYWRVAQTPATPDLPGNLNPAFGHLAWSSPHWVKVE